jgi:alkylation response protein AidB-like acyl-CoA dehydrogenase
MDTSLAALVRFELRWGNFLEGSVGVRVYLRGLDLFMTEPQRDDRAVDVGLQQIAALCFSTPASGSAAGRMRTRLWQLSGYRRRAGDRSNGCQ